MSKDTDIGDEAEQQVTLQDSAEKAFDTLSGVEPVEKALATPKEPEAPAFELPSWAKMWGEPARNALQAIGGITHNKGHLDPILKQIEETNQYTTKRDQEYAEYRKSVDPVYSVLRDLEPSYRMQGMSLQQGVSQLVEGAKFVATNPDDAFPYFANMYRPRDPATAVQSIAKQWGVDLGQIVQEQPYIDPTVQALLNPLQQKLAAIEQQSQQQQWQAQEQARAQQEAIQKAIVEKLASLEVQKDESGSLRFPHLAKVFDDIVILANTGRYQTIEDAYDRAVLMNPELSQSVVKDAEQKAIKEALARSENVKKEARANQNVGGKGKKSETPQGKSLTDAATLAYNQLYGTD